MASLNTLPLEVLAEIVFGLDHNLRDLWAISLVSKRLWEIASPTLYADIDLRVDERVDSQKTYNEIEEIYERSAERQTKLLRSIAENSTLGSMVRSFGNHFEVWGPATDVTQDQWADFEMFVRAAQNMKNLSRAFLTSSSIANYVIPHLPDYQEIRELTIEGLYPETQVWPSMHTRLKSLKWNVPILWSPANPDRNPWDQVEFLEKVVQITCLELESLDISVSRSGVGLFPPLSSAAKEYLSLESSAMPKLQHFGFKPEIYSENRQNLNVIRRNYIEFVRKYSQTLESLTIPVPAGTWSNKTVNFLLEVWALVPKIKSISLVRVPCPHEPDARELSGASFFETITGFLASPKYEIESFSTVDIGTHFSGHTGHLFGRWKSLRTLKLRDGHNSTGPFNDQGIFLIGKYTLKIQDFISELPLSLEQLFLQLNANSLILDEDSDFDLLHDLAPGIFKTLPNLHTCDIHAWIPDRKETGIVEWSPFPDRAVFFRRLPREGQKTKGMWRLRINDMNKERNLHWWIYEEELEGEFGGKDADDYWVDWIQKIKVSGASKHSHEAFSTVLDCTLPFSKDIVSKYPMF